MQANSEEKDCQRLCYGFGKFLVLPVGKLFVCYKKFLSDLFLLYFHECYISTFFYPVTLLRALLRQSDKTPVGSNEIAN